jgi:hypothetical protein
MANMATTESENGTIDTSLDAESAVDPVEQFAAASPKLHEATAAAQHLALLEQADQGRLRNGKEGVPGEGKQETVTPEREKATFATKNTATITLKPVAASASSWSHSRS